MPYNSNLDGGKTTQMFLAPFRPLCYALTNIPELRESLLYSNFNNAMSSTPNEKISALHEAQKKFFATTKTQPLMWRKQQLAKVVKFIDECSTQISDALTKDLG